MNSGTTSTELNDMLTNFVNYVDSFYGDKKEALYPLFNVDTDKQVDKTDILGAVYDYLHEITRRNDDHFTWWIQLGDKRMELDKQEYNLIKYCLDNAMVNLHADTKKIATDVLIKLSNQVKDHEN